MKQYEAVRMALAQNGGFATLGWLNQNVLKIPGCEWKTRTPFASIRRIVQEDPEIFRIRPGLWGLSKQRDAILHQLQIEPETAARAVQAETFNHSYFQGLLLEIGGWESFATFVPHQDKNRAFLKQRLRDVATLGDYPPFTYDHVTRRGQTVDVTWFNERRFPHALFEVEHSTDIHNALVKFVEFQDFRVRLVIVADESRRSEYAAKIELAAFAPIRERVAFVNYERVSRWHSIASTRALELSGILSP